MNTKRNVFYGALLALCVIVLAASGWAVQTSATTDVMPGSLQMYDNKAIIFGTGSDSSLQYDETTTDRTLFTSVAGSGFNILTGNLYVGNGTPGQTINGEDAYIEGLLEVDGVAYADGGVKVPDDTTICFGATDDGCIKYDEAVTDSLLVTGTELGLSEGATIADDKTLTFGNDSDWTIKYDETTSDDLMLAGSAAASVAWVTTGNFAIGNASPTVALDGDDLFVKGHGEFDGMCYADGGVTVATSATLSYATATTPTFLNASKQLVTGAFTVASGANAACTATCGATKICIFGQEATSKDILACTDNTADVCVCLGAP